MRPAKNLYSKSNKHFILLLLDKLRWLTATLDAPVLHVFHGRSKLES